jgi:hypothetical protein
MKMVFNTVEVAEALALSVVEFEQVQVKLYNYGFPQPVPGLEQRWSIISVINWLNQAQTRVNELNTEGLLDGFLRTLQ